MAQVPEVKCVVRTSCDDSESTSEVLADHVKLPGDFAAGTYTEELTGELDTAVLQKWRDLLLQVRSDCHRSGSLVQSSAAEAFGLHYQNMAKNEGWNFPDPAVSHPWP